MTRPTDTGSDEIQRSALGRGVTRRLLSADLETVRVIDRALTRLEQLGSLSWVRRIATGPGDEDRTHHLISLGRGGNMVTRCNGSWSATDAVETSLDGPPLHELCLECARRWARGKDRDLYGLLELARDLATEGRLREPLREAARVEMARGVADEIDRADEQARETAREHRRALTEAESRPIGGGRDRL